LVKSLISRNMAVAQGKHRPMDSRAAMAYRMPPGLPC
jgi:hypothetical protein